MLSENRLREVLRPFALELSDNQTRQILAYLTLLMRWNEKINLTAIRDEEEAAARHFGESLFVSRHLALQGRLLDIGSGAGFPGLALKIAFPELAVTLLEPVTKKRAFLKETARVCGFSQVEVRPDRLQDFLRTGPEAFDVATMRAVGDLEALVPLGARSLKPSGQMLLWLGHDQAADLKKIESGLVWAEPIPIPTTRSGEIWRGSKLSGK
jgi:16S rRNA (guanine527-N7)-methyltransferase